MFEIEVNRGVATLVLRAGKVNAMDIELVEALTGAYEDLAQDDAVKALIVAGNDRVFSAGVDLKRLLAEDNRYIDRFLPALSRLFLTALEFPRPVVMAVTGHAIAGGCVLACTGDWRVISENARIGVPELRVGVPFPVAGMEIMRWSATANCFRQMINIGATWTGAAAINAGLADEACAGAAVLESARRAVDELRLVPAHVFALTKQQQRSPVLAAIASGSPVFDAEVLATWKADATRQAIQRYVTDRLK